MATIYLHIGAPKTATSTIQRILARNYKKLLKNGILYPRDQRHGDAHHTLVCDLIEKHQNIKMPDLWYGECSRGQAWQSLLDEISRHEPEIHTVILSSELLFGQSKNLDQMLEDISSYLGGHELKVVAYLRRQDQLYSSFYNQDVKGIRQWSHSAYQFYEVHQMFQRDYHSLLSLWSDSLGRNNILIRPYESEQWLNGDIVQDFCALVNIPSLNSGSVSSNESLGINQLYIKLCLNRIGFEKCSNDDILRLIAKVYPEKPAKGCLYVRSKLYLRYRSQWLLANKKLEQDFLHGKTLFEQPIPSAKELKQYAVDRMALAVFFPTLVKKIKNKAFGDHNQLFAQAAALMLAEENLWAALDAQERATLMEWVC